MGEMPARPAGALGGRHVAVATAVGVVVLVGAGALLWWLMHRQDPDVDYYELARSTVIAVAAIGAVPAGYIAYRRQRTQELQRWDERQDAVRAEDDEFRDRYVDAATQLGSPDAATRMAGIYALAQLADEWGRERDRSKRQMCVDVLCAYLRIPYGPQDGAAPDRPGEREVRRTLIRVIRDHLREDKVGDPDLRWSNLSFSFEGAYFDCGDFTGARFAGGFVSFHATTFAATGTIHFRDVTFATRAFFGSAVVESGTVDFRGAALEPGSAEGRRPNEVDFTGFQVARGARVLGSPDAFPGCPGVDLIPWQDRDEDARPGTPDDVRGLGWRARILNRAGTLTSRAVADRAIPGPMTQPGSAER